MPDLVTKLRLVITQIDRAAWQPRVLLPLIPEPVGSTLGFGRSKLLIADLAPLEVAPLALAKFIRRLRSCVSQAPVVSSERQMAAQSATAGFRPAHCRICAAGPRELACRVEGFPVLFRVELGHGGLLRLILPRMGGIIIPRRFRWKAATKGQLPSLK